MPTRTCRANAARERRRNPLRERGSLAVTENEAVERMAALILAASKKGNWHYEAASIALTSHPAVYALRKLLDAQCHADGPDVLGHVMREARTVLANLPKEK